MLEKTLESPLDCREIQPVPPKGDQSWVFIGRTNGEAEPPSLWPQMQRANLFEKTLMLGKIEGRRRTGRQRLRWLEWHHQLNGHECEQSQGDSEGQGSLACCSPWGHKESDMTERLKTTKITTPLFLPLSHHRCLWKPTASVIQTGIVGCYTSCIPKLYNNPAV